MPHTRRNPRPRSASKRQFSQKSIDSDVEVKERPNSSRYFKLANREIGYEAALASSLIASGSGGAMIGAILGPLGAVIGGAVGVAAAYVVEKKNAARQ